MELNKGLGDGKIKLLKLGHEPKMCESKERVDTLCRTVQINSTFQHNLLDMFFCLKQIED